MSPIPQDFATWHRCITVDCGITLTPEYIRERLRRLGDERDTTTKQFAKLYGEAYRNQVVGWFRQAEAQFDR